MFSRRGVVAVALGAAGAALFVAACGDSKLAGNGAECFVASDCVAPLVCIAQKGGGRICTDNLESVEGQTPPEAAAPAVDAGDEAGEAGEPAETGTPDAGKPDTGAPKDSGKG